ncbi:caspase family protein [soil metagenome]
MTRSQPASLFLRALFAFAFALCCVSVASAANSHGRRIALVIGNGNYQNPEIPKLLNPANDAEDIAKVLRGFGFEVIERKDQSLQSMNKAIAEFGSKIGGSEAALFYYAGHGIQVKGQNYLMPVDATMESEASVPYQNVNVNQILDEMDNGKSGTNIVMLDACRNNPISGKFRSGPTRGLASPGSTPKGTVIIYATDPGNVAADGKGRNGLFTAGLLSAFKGKDLTLDGVLTVASAEVEQASGQKQTPYVNGPKTLQKNFNFRITVEPGRGEIEKTFWSSIERSSDPADFQAYLKKYPEGSYAALAENRLKALKTTAAAPSVVPNVVPSVVPSVAPSSGPSSSFDGQWSVALVCEDAQDRNKLVKGYKMNFPLEVRQGQMRGQAGAAGKAASLVMTGSIQADGTADIAVNGLSGNPDNVFGHINPGTPYSYHMRGSFTSASGKASRIELRPCVANFSRN